MSHPFSVGSRTRRRLVASILGAAALAALPGSALAVTRGSETMKAASDRTARVFFDSRSSDRASVRQVQSASRAAGSRVRSARAAELKSLGAGGKLQLDALTGTPRSLQNLSGTLSGSTGGSPASVALGFARSHAAILGLSSADLDALGAPKIVTSPSGISSVRFSQSYQGVPAYDNDLRINLDRVNRVLSVTGSSVHDLSVASVTPKLSATQALSALMRHVGVRRDVSVKSAASDARRSTTFSNGDIARLVLFHGKSGTRLAWHLMYSATSQAVYDAIVDASSGAILRRANMVKNVNGSVFENYPGDVNGGTQATVSLDPYLTNPGTATKLDGPFAHTYKDIDSNNVAAPTEEVVPAQYPFTDFDNTDAPNSFCLVLKPCGWDPNTATSWTTNQNEAAVQAHYYVSKFHDHLLTPDIGFDAADGNFEGADRVEVNANDGAATDLTGPDAGGPDANHIDNANMSTPPDGIPPRMQMYLFNNKSDPSDPFRGINGDDDARIVYHEYTHGLSNRLVTSDGFSALGSAQSGAMGEAWSDWYAMDFLVAQALETDTAAAGDINMGEYSDGIPNSIRREPLDCPPNSGGAACPGGVDTGGPGGFTYADFGHIDSDGPEVHADGEIWAQTLWDLRAALGSAAAERIVTDGMRLSPPEPSFLDMRNAILAADAAAPTNGANRGAIWAAFAARGMGFYASAADGSDVTPVADFSTPPAAGVPTGGIAGRITDADTGLPISGVLVGLAGHMSDPTFPDYLAATTSADGRYGFAGVPQSTYPLLYIPPTAGYDPVKVANVTITGGGTVTRDAALKRDWAGFRGGADIGGNDDFGGPFGCGQLQLIDQALGIGYSPFAKTAPISEGNPHFGADPFAVVELPKAITVDTFAVDPGNTCGDGPSATTKDYTIETSPDGVTFSVAKAGSFVPADAHRLNMLAPTANATNVKFVKITSHSAQGMLPGNSGALFWDLSELEVYGNTVNKLPAGNLSASPGTVAPGQTVTLTATFTDEDSAITGYDWDFDGNGSVDQTTAGPSTTTSYATAGDRLAKVAAKDFRGGAGNASTTVKVTGSQPVALPTLTLRSSGTRSRLTYRVRCFAVCRVSARLTIDRKTARKLGLRSRTVGSNTKTIQPGATRTVTVKLSSKVVRAMRRHRVRRLRATLKVTASYADGRRKTATKRASIRR